MNSDLILSAVTAFVISAGGSFLMAAVVLPANAPFTWQIWSIALAFGAVSAAKDIRSFKRLPPVEPPATK